MTEIVDDRTESRAGVALALTPGVAHWTRVCQIDRLTPGRGAVARVAGEQVAVFRVPTDDDRDLLFALGNHDPFSGAQVMSRGIVGDRSGIPKVTSPIYKQGFDLRTGACLDDPDVSVPVYRVTVSDDGWVSVGVPVGVPAP